MDTGILKVVGQVAGVAGIGMGVFLLLFRDLIRKTFFPQLGRREAFRIILLFMVLTWSVAIAGIAAWVYVTIRAGSADTSARAADAVTVPVLTATLKHFSLYGPGESLATTEIRGQPDGDLSNEDLRSLLDWVKRELVPTVPDPVVSEPEPPSSVTVRVRIPAGPGPEGVVIERSPPGPISTEVWEVSEGGGDHGGRALKVLTSANPRARVDLERLQSHGKRVDLVITVPAYGTRTIERDPGEAVDTAFELAREPERSANPEITIGVSGGPADADIINRLNGLMAGDPFLVACDPDGPRLEAVRESINLANAAAFPLAESPMAPSEDEPTTGGPSGENSAVLRREYPQYLLVCSTRRDRLPK